MLKQTACAPGTAVLRPFCTRRRLWLAIAWWGVLLLRGILPAVFAIAVRCTGGRGRDEPAALVARSPSWPPSSWRCRF